MIDTCEIHDTGRDFFSGCVPTVVDEIDRPVSQPCRHAPSAADLLLKVLGDARARMRSPQWAAARIAEIDRQIAELHREREIVARSAP
jgi:hypothetical protein